MPFTENTCNRHNDYTLLITIYLLYVYIPVYLESAQLD